MKPNLPKHDLTQSEQKRIRRIKKAIRVLDETAGLCLRMRGGLGRTTLWEAINVLKTVEQYIVDFGEN